MARVFVCRAGETRFAPASTADLPALLAASDTLVWVDIEGAVESDIALLRGVFGFHELTIDDCLNHRADPPKVDDYGDYLFVIVQGAVFSHRDETIRTPELNLYLGRRFVVTFHHTAMASVEETVRRVTLAAPLPARGAGWLAHAVIDALVDSILPIVEQMDEEISRLEDRALDHPGPDLLARSTSLKRGVLRLRRAVAPQREVLNRLARGDFPALVPVESTMYYRDVFDHLMRLEDLVESLRDLGDSVISSYLASTNNRMNEVMKALSVVGTIFLPLTLLASVFGTNFAPTYEDWGWPGFFGMVLFMVASIAAAVWIFRRRGWL